MNYKGLKNNWYKRNFHKIPEKYKTSFLQKIGFNNLSRLRIILAVYLFVILLLTVLHLQGKGLGDFVNAIRQLEYDIILLVPSFIFLLLSYLRNPKSEDKVLIYHRILVLVGSLIFLVNVAAISGMLESYYSGLYYSISVFAISLFLYFRIYELISLYFISASVLVLVSVSLGSEFNTVINEYKYLGIYLPVVLIVSRIFFGERLKNYINWHNLADINEQLKNEISVKESTEQDLFNAKKDLEIRVDQRTIELKQTNEKLLKEISDRKYADKIKSVLYNISNLINRTNNLDKLFAVIHNELRSVMDVKNFFIARYNKEDDKVSIIFQLNDREEFSTFETGKTFTGYVIKNQNSLLVNGQEFNDMIEKGEVEIVGVKAHSWLGVPLFIKGEAIGAVVVQTYDKTKWYTKMDQEVLEFIGEHIATAIEQSETERRLLEAKEKAEESNKLKTSFLANMSHEIRTPMNAIVGFSDLLNDKTITNKERHNYTHYIKKSSTSLLRILEDIIVVSRLQSNLLKLVIREFSLNKFILDLNYEFSDIREEENKLGIKLVYHLPDTRKDVKMVSDSDKIKQVYKSLVHNSFKFTEFGQIEYGYSVLDDGNIEFFVKDTGIGFEKEKGELIFDIFRQVDESTTRQYGGTGLGLSIAKGIVELLGGKIKFDSEHGVGTTFFFTIPDQSEVKNEQQKVKTEKKNSYNWENKLILVSTNLEAQYLLYEKVLSKTNAKIIWTRNGKETIEMCKSNTDIDIVLAGMEVPEDSDFDLSRSIKEFRKELPIIGMLSEKTKNKKVTAKNFDTVINQPINEEPLLHTIEQLFHAV